MNIPLSPYVPENLVSRGGFIQPSLLASACSFSILRLNLVLTYGIPTKFRGGVHYLYKTAVRHRVSPEFIGSRSCVPMAFTAENPPAQGHYT